LFLACSYFLPNFSLTVHCSYKIVLIFKKSVVLECSAANHKFKLMTVIVYHCIMMHPMSTDLSLY